MDIIGLIAAQKEVQKLTSYQIAKRSGLPLQMVQRIETSNKEYLGRLQAVLRALGYEILIKPVAHGLGAIVAHHQLNNPEHLNAIVNTDNESYLKEFEPQSHWKQPRPIEPLRPKEDALKLAKSVLETTSKKGK